MRNLYRNIATLIIPVLMVLGLVAITPLTTLATPASEVTKGVKAAGDSDAKNCGSEDNPRKCTLADTIGTITNVLLFIVGTVSVIMIIIGGIRYTTSNGDASQVTAAKNTILYAVIGVIVSLLAFAISDFVVEQFSK